jgi:hypothetical protein
LAPRRDAAADLQLYAPGVILDRRFTEIGAPAGRVKSVQMSQALVKTAAGWLLGLMLAAIAAVISINLVSNSVASPQQPVREYLAALKAGDGETALGLLGATVPASSAAMLDGTALQTAAAGIQDVKLGNAERRSGNQVAVPMDYTMSGTKYHTEFLLERTGTEWLFFSKWSFVPSSLPTIDVSVVNSSQASMNGVPVNMPNGRNSFAVFYPGEYEGSLSGEFFAADPAKVTVTNRDAAQAPLDLLTKATDKMKQAVSDRVKQFLDECAAKATEQQRLQPDCPFYHTTNSRVVDGSIKWEIREYPKVNIEPFDGRWVVSPLNGKARVMAREIDLYTGLVLNLDQDHDFSFTTRLEFGADTVTIVPVLSS